jgi:hypothetical protein
VLIDVAPILYDAFPTVHVVQAEDAVVEENVPDAQSLQTEAPVTPENLPSAQFVQLVDDFAPSVVKNLPISHLVHTDD